MNIFIDTNIFLSFYHLTSEDLEELEKLALLIENKEIILLLSEQVIDETRRNRASKINDSFERFKKTKFTISYPAYCKDYAQYDEMREAQKNLENLHSDMVKEIQVDIEGESLEADNLINRLLALGTVISRDHEIISKARDRLDIGNPPGKKNSLGDAINWESLLSHTHKHQMLCLIADDSDFYSPLNSNKLNEFLNKEWIDKKNSTIYFYRRLSDFFKRFYPDISLETELEKDSLIAELSSSRNFSTTHSLIAQLSKFDGFTQKQIEDLVNALFANNQIYWIIRDDDIHDFYERLRNENPFSEIPHYEELNLLLSPEEDEITF